MSISMKKSQYGFTLIEILVAVAIIGILGAIAVSAYKDQSDRGRRSDAKAFIMDIAARQERFYTRYVSYTDELTPGGANCVGTACGLGLGANQSPDGYYTANISLTPIGCAPGGTTCTGYTTAVTPTFIDPKCTELTRTHTGVEGSTGTENTEFCWK